MPYNNNNKGGGQTNRPRGNFNNNINNNNNNNNNKNNYNRQNNSQGRGNSSNNRNKFSNKKGSYNKSSSKFMGRCEELKGYIYDYNNTNKNTDQFVTTTREIANYVGRTYKYGGDVKICLIKMKEITIPVTPRSSDTNNLRKAIFEAEVKEYVQRKT